MSLQAVPWRGRATHWTRNPVSAGRVGATWVELVETKTYRGQAGYAESRLLGFDTLRYSTGVRSPGFAHDDCFLVGAFFCDACPELVACTELVEVKGSNPPRASEEIASAKTASQ